MAKSRRERRLRRLKKHKVMNDVEVSKDTSEAPEVSKEPAKKEYRNVFSRIYDTQYKRLVLIPLILLLLAFIVLGVNMATTGDFMNRGVSLKGGLTLTIPSEEPISILELEVALNSEFPANDIVVRGLSELGVQRGVIIEADITPDEREGFIFFVEGRTGIDEELYSIEEIGSSLGASFFKQTMIAVLFAFVFMGLVVFWYFRTLVPSGAVILAAFSDIVVTLAIVNLMGMKIGTAGIAAFLMLIGYSVDTDILLSTRVLKRTEGTVMKRVYGAMKTGLTMNGSTIVAVTAALILADSEVIKQIMTIILIGLFVDIINTWIQNVSILRYYLEKKGIK
ncbi:MAG: protein translocase subunit SecF [Nanoarchaeota archaeon]|nr:protein translocase subunit SecF [DPANN group archaeon]MBL7116970.1 protein translocase subunit SecF [Nanoarchaeota archaeon]